MHPDLFSIGPFSIHAYGAALAVSFLLGIMLALRRAERRGIPQRDVMDLFQIIIVSAIIGSRFFFVIFHLDSYQGKWWHAFYLWEGGLTLYGGILLSFLTAWFFLRRRRISFARMADVMSPSLGMGIMITRVGCFLNGCCYGKPTDSILGMGFPHDSEANRTAITTLVRQGCQVASGESVHIHPAQLYSSFGGLVILVLLLVLDNKRRPAGFTFANFLFIYGIHRFSVDLFRYYEEVMRVLGLSVNQWLSIAFVLSAVIIHWRLGSFGKTVRPSGAEL